MNQQNQDADLLQRLQQVQAQVATLTKRLDERDRIIANHRAQIADMQGRIDALEDANTPEPA